MKTLIILVFVIALIAFILYVLSDIFKPDSRELKQLEDPTLKEIDDAADPTILPTHPTSNQIDIGCFMIVDDINRRNLKFDKVIGVLRGGEYPAKQLGQMLNVPVEFIKYSSKAGEGDDKNHDNILPPIREKALLIVDDIADSGKTLDEMFRHYIVRKHTVFTAVLYYKDRHGGFVPDFWWKHIPEDFGWVVFPWEVERGAEK